ncbi:MAG: prepilin-type N-terminal cleavage/methylation domain-containing protein [Cytophagaceae bacterium]
MSKSLKGVSLIEVVIAMVIIAITYSIGIMIYINVLYSSYDIRKIEAIHLADNCANKALHEKTFYDEQIEFNDFYVERKVSPHQNGLMRMDIEVYSKNNKLLAKRKELVRVP